MGHEPTSRLWSIQSIMWKDHYLTWFLNWRNCWGWIRTENNWFKFIQYSEKESARERFHGTNTGMTQALHAAISYPSPWAVLMGFEFHMCIKAFFAWMWVPLGPSIYLMGWRPWLALTSHALPDKCEIRSSFNELICLNSQKTHACSLFTNWMYIVWCLWP